MWEVRQIIGFGKTKEKFCWQVNSDRVLRQTPGWKIEMWKGLQIWPLRQNFAVIEMKKEQQILAGLKPVIFWHQTTVSKWKSRRCSFSVQHARSATTCCHIALRRGGNNMNWGDIFIAQLSLHNVKLNSTASAVIFLSGNDALQNLFVFLKTFIGNCFLTIGVWKCRCPGIKTEILLDLSKRREMERSCIKHWLLMIKTLIRLNLKWRSQSNLSCTFRSGCSFHWSRSGS